MDLSRRAGIYLHVPFCRRKCPYCSFASVVPRPGQVGHYLAAVRAHLRGLAREPQVREMVCTTVFFGGGTPSLLDPADLAELLADCRTLFAFADDEPEVSVEVNPGTIDPAGLERLRRAGCNRLSIGVQSLDDRELAVLGRIHSAGQARAAVRAARDAGFENLSLDLMYGLPGQSAAGWRATLEQALALGPDHLSLYELTPEEGTPLSADLCAGRLSLPSEEEVLAMMAVIDALVAASPLARYEISNYAAVGRECRHNLTYWQNGCYLGLGPGATAFYGGVRRTAVADPDEYCRRLGQGRSVWQVEECLDREAAFRETVVMGLRLTAGVDEAALRRRFGIDPATYYGPVLAQLFAQGLLVRQAGHLRLTAAGLPLANRVMAELV